MPGRRSPTRRPGRFYPDLAMTTEQYQAVMEELGAIKQRQKVQGATIDEIDNAIRGTRGGKRGINDRLRSVERFVKICLWGIAGVMGAIGTGVTGQALKKLFGS